MRWLSAQQVREIFREVLGWDVHPKTLRVWARTGKLRSVVSPGRGRTFYPIEEVAEVLGLEPSQVAAIVQKEKGGRP
jgi:predicted site-specific integrase-resolvase